MSPPITQTEYLTLIAKETAKMSYPGSMSLYNNPIVSGGTKELVEDYFTYNFPMTDVWAWKFDNREHFDQWHDILVNRIALRIRNNVEGFNNRKSVAAKFLNTFLHQLMKHKEARHMFNYLHLPLDRNVFKNLRRIRPILFEPIREIFNESPYQTNYNNHITVQKLLTLYIRELNKRPDAEFRFYSRIQLNWLWFGQ